MTRNKFAVVVLAMVTILAATAVAQKSNEVAGIVGRSFISDQGISGSTSVHFGDGLTYEGNVSHRFIYFGLAGISVELPFVFTPTNKVQFGGANVVPKDFSAFFITPAARINLFPTTSFSPWVSVGGGYARFNPSSTLEFGGTNPSQTTSGGVFEVGGGLDVRIAGNFKLRGEIRDFNASEPPINLKKGDRYSHLFAGAGVVFSF
jgi:opacity protein-like surface antigen